MLYIQNLEVSFGSRKVLQGISLELNKGEALAVVGESGAGKTTLGLAVSGMIGRPDAGSGRSRQGGRTEGKILFQGKDILQAPEEELRQLRWNRIAYVFQNVVNALNPVLPVIDQVAEPVWTHGLGTKRQAWERARTMLEKTGLEAAKAKKYPHQLSGGELQRSLLAMALINEPDLLILDEPTASLDPVIKKEILTILKEAAQNCAVLLITHDLAVASALSQRTAVLYQGLVLEEGPSEKVLQTPHHPYMRALLRSYPNMTTTKDIQSIKQVSGEDLPGCPFQTRCTQAIEICREAVPELKQISIGLQSGPSDSSPVLFKNVSKVACHRGGIVPSLIVHKFKKKYNASFTLQETSFILFEGETVALVGQSGSGKSTIARLIMGLEDPDQGNLLLEERKAAFPREPDFYSKVQMVFQNPYDAFNSRLTVLEAVTEPLAIQKKVSKEERNGQGRKVLQEVGLPTTADFLESYPGHLSGGELQRLAIARALIVDPEILVADEPTSALDAIVQARVIKLLMDLQEQRGLGILFITHDLALARKIADRIIVLDNGIQVEQGLSWEISTRPKHPITRKLILSAAEIFE